MNRFNRSRALAITLCPSLIILSAPTPLVATQPVLPVAKPKPEPVYNFNPNEGNRKQRREAQRNSRKR